MGFVFQKIPKGLKSHSKVWAFRWKHSMILLKKNLMPLDTTVGCRFLIFFSNVAAETLIFFCSFIVGQLDFR